MKLDLNTLLEEIQSWKKLLREKDEEIDGLKNSIQHAEKQNKSLENAHSNFQQEISQFNEAVSKLHISMSRLQKNEIGKQTLLEDKKKLKTAIEEQEKLHLNKVNEMKKEIEELKETHSIEVEKLLVQADLEAFVKFDSSEKKLDEKEKHILVLEDDIVKLRQEKDQDILKITIEYEEKLRKLKNQLCKPKSSHSLHNDFKKEDIFRQKYLRLVKESEEVSLRLRSQIEELQSQLQTAKCNTTPPVSALLLNSNQNKANHVKRVVNDSNCFHSAKRPKTDETYPGEHVLVEFINKDGNSCRPTETVKPVKKKLFNPDRNYFVK